MRGLDPRELHVAHLSLGTGRSLATRDDCAAIERLARRGLMAQASSRTEGPLRVRVYRLTSLGRLVFGAVASLRT